MRINRNDSGDTSQMPQAQPAAAQQPQKPAQQPAAPQKGKEEKKKPPKKTRAKPVREEEYNDEDEEPRRRFPFGCLILLLFAALFAVAVGSLCLYATTQS